MAIGRLTHHCRSGHSELAIRADEYISDEGFAVFKGNLSTLGIDTYYVCAIPYPCPELDCFVVQNTVEIVMLRAGSVASSIGD